MKVGFTGTRKGMTPQQKKTFKDLLIELKPTRFIHGDCIGSDADAHKIAVDLGIGITIYPPRKNDLRAHCKAPGAAIMPVGDYLPRNIKIVDACNLLLATPESYENEHRSGTWFTVRQAKKRGKPCKVILPNGQIA
jgi:predicted Rossmann fold nucleotide-binding protein DprA/Smf involved in DNA uptake